MTAKAKKAEPEPLDVQLSVAFQYGKDKDDRVVMLDDQTVPMVGSVFANRSRIIRGFLSLLLKASVVHPKVVRELIPPLKLMRPLRPLRARR